MEKMVKKKMLFFHLESWELEEIKAWWSASFVDPGHIKFLQLEVTSNLYVP